MQNLEAEYRKSQQEETPDLWNRIESALSEKPVQSVSPAMPQNMTTAPVQKTKKIYKFARFTKAAAAVLFMALIIPGAWFLMNQTTNMGESENAAMDTATADAGAVVMEAAADGAVAGDTTGSGVVTMDSDGDSNGYRDEESCVDSVTEQFWADEEAEIESADQKLAEDVESGSSAETRPETESAGAESPAEPQANEESVAELGSALQICEEITLESIEKEESDGQAGEETVYRLRTAEGEVLVAILSQDLTVVLTEGNTYRFTLEAVSGEAWEYQIVNVEMIEAD